MTGLLGGRGWSLAIIGDVQSESVGVVVDDNARPRRSGVLEGVRERLLDNAVGGQVEAGRQRPRPALHPDLDFDAGLLYGLGEGRKIVQSRLRRQRWRVIVAQDAKEAAQLGQRLPAGLLHSQEGRHSPIRVVGQLHPGGSRVHGHNADAVCDHVVQLPRDSAALGGGCSLGALLVVPLKLDGARFGGGGAAATARQ